MSTYILAGVLRRRLRRFAEEVAPAVRELGRGARRSGRGRSGAARPRRRRPRRRAARRHADAGRRPRLSDEQPWDETTRPTGPPPDPSRRYTPDQQAAGRHLIDVHDAPAARADPAARPRSSRSRAASAEAAAARSFITRMTIRQNHWTLGTFCETYCRVVTQHHTLEDRSVFPHLRRSDPALAPGDRAPRGGARDDRRPARARRPGARRARLVAGRRHRRACERADRTCSPTRCSRTSPTRSAS